MTDARPLRILFWGTYDTGKPRTRILLQGLRELGVEVSECHTEVWGGIEDKSQVSGTGAKLRLLVKWIMAYPGLLVRFQRLPRADVVIVPYMGLIDVLILWPFAKLRRLPVIWDAFLSIYNTVAEDRRMVSPRHPLAWVLWAVEWLACRAADRIILDTNAHAAYFANTFKVDPAKLARVFVGAETDVFARRMPRSPRQPDDPFTVLFYGQFIPLHGIETVVRAAKLTEQDRIHWQIIGTGQEAPRIRALIAEMAPRNLDWLEWVPYRELVEWMQRTDVCLGIFGTTDKAQRVIPNKVFQALAADCPIITSDTPAIRELATLLEENQIMLVDPGNPQSLAFAATRKAHEGFGSIQAKQANIAEVISPRAVCKNLYDIAIRLASAPT